MPRTFFPLTDIPEERMAWKTVDSLPEDGRQVLACVEIWGVWLPWTALALPKAMGGATHVGWPDPTFWDDVPDFPNRFDNRHDQSEWQPIDSAPDDLRMLLIAAPHAIGWTVRISAGLWKPRDGFRFFGDPEPSHWTPLPDPPAPDARWGS